MTEFLVAVSRHPRRGVALTPTTARLRAVGEAALTAHLAAQVGRTHRVLTEGPRIGRTEQFTEVSFARDLPEGTLLDVTITGHDGTRLVA